MKNFFEDFFSPLLLFITSLFLLVTSIVVFIVFIKNKELTKGIYSTILICISCEIIFALNHIKTSLALLAGIKLTNNFWCIWEAGFCLFFHLFWLSENCSIILLFFLRKLQRSKICNLLHFISFIFSLMITLFMLFNNSLGISMGKSCFISKEANSSIIFLTILVLFVLFLSIFFNFWFYKLRNSFKDRSFINDYNTFIFFICLFKSIYFLNLTFEYFIGGHEEAFYYICFFANILLSVYTGIFRMRMEYITLFFSNDNGEGKYRNILRFISCKYKLPKFKEIKKRLNVKYIQDIDVDENKKDMLYSHIARKNIDF